jgi:hypothetical protein
MRLFHKKIILVLLLASLLPITGCVYFRLLELKKQCAAFEDYFDVEEKDGLTITLRKPVLYDKDIRWMGFEPSFREKAKDGETWTLVLEKMYLSPKDEPGNFNITFSLLFRNQKLKAMQISEHYLVVFPKEFVIEMFKSFGGAEIDKKNRTVTGNKQTTGGNLSVPCREEAVRLLGKPYATEDKEDTEILSYKYRPKVTGEPYCVRLEFSRETSNLLRVKSSLFLGSINMDYSKLVERHSGSKRE